MKVFVDTSALYALLVSGDENHGAAARFFRELDTSTTHLVTSSFVMLEFVSLLQSRVGLAAIRDFKAHFEALLDIVWVDSEIYNQAMTAMTSAERRKVSLTDWSSYAVMRRLSISRAFTFDEHFAQQGFELVPGPQ